MMRLVYIFFLFLFVQKGLSQSTAIFDNSFTTKTTDQEKFSIYLDSLDKYLYRDATIAQYALEECKKIIDRGTAIPDSLLLKHATSQVYIKFSKNEALGAYQIVLDNEHLTQREGIPTNDVNRFNYIKGFTYMSLGDLEAAQKAYYELYELSTIQKDSSIMSSALFSLGQLFNDQKDYEASINTFKKVIALSTPTTSRPSSLALTHIELGEVYMGLEQYQEAKLEMDIALDITKANQLDVLHFDALILKGHIYLAQNKIELAENIYLELQSKKIIKDQNHQLNVLAFHAGISRSKKMYAQALASYQTLLEKTDSSNINRLIDTYNSAHELCIALNDYEAAYSYLLAYNKTNNKRNQDIKRQKTDYLKIKYSYDQKEKDNAFLAAKIIQSEAERKILYGSIILSVLFLTFLIAAFYQKSRYSEKLEKTVLSRTLKLKESNEMLNQSNQELEEFNRILSHDLKEPVRSIVGFSQLASRDLNNTTKLEEYLGFVTKSGLQLGRLIQDVGDYRMLNSTNIEVLSSNSIQTILNAIVFHLQKKYPSKHISIEYSSDPNIIGPTKILRSLFHHILDNAVKFNQNQTVNIKVIYHLKNQSHFLAIEDNGIGIAPKYHRQIFEMFKKLNNKNTYPGSGLGLNIARRLLEKIGGEISVQQSEENIGSTFMIRLPVRKEHQRTASASSNVSAEMATA